MKQELDFSNLIKEQANEKAAQRESAVVDFSAKMMTGLRKKSKDNKIPLSVVVASFAEGFRKATGDSFSRSAHGLVSVNQNSKFGLEYQLEHEKGSEHLTELDLLTMDEALLKKAEEEIREWGILNDKNFSDMDELYLEADTRNQEFIKSHL
jgi:hypothetical protein